MKTLIHGRAARGPPGQRREVVVSTCRCGRCCAVVQLRVGAERPRPGGTVAIRKHKKQWRLACNSRARTCLLPSSLPAAVCTKLRIGSRVAPNAGECPSCLAQAWE